MRDGKPGNGYAPPFCTVPDIAEMLPSQRLGARSTQGDLRSRFYDKYRKEAEEYDRDFVKKHDDDLNTTLIFVSLASRSDAHGLTRTAGRSVLRRHIRLHHPGPPTAPARSERRDGRSPPRPHLQDGQHHVRWRRSRHSAMVRPSAHNRPGPSHTVRQSRRIAFLRLPRDARQAVAKPVRLRRHARVRHRA